MDVTVEISSTIETTVEINAASVSDSGGTINVYVDSILQSTTTSTDLDSETVNITWT